MAKIKTSYVSLGGETYQITINCTTNGLFYCNLPFEVYSLLGCDVRITANTLQELESWLNTSVIQFNVSVKKQRVMILIKFKANGAFIRSESGDEHPLFSKRTEFLAHKFPGDPDSITFDFFPMIEETIGRKKIYYAAVDIRNWSEENRALIDKDKIVGSFKKGKPNIVCENEIVIPYTETTYSNLLSVKEQFRKASIFIASLLDQPNIGNILSNQNMKQIENKQYESD